MLEPLPPEPVPVAVAVLLAALAGARRMLQRPRMRRALLAGVRAFVDELGAPRTGSGGASRAPARAREP
jgi:hypothetical protein